jgi:hypothetical protein
MMQLYLFFVAIILILIITTIKIGFFNKKYEKTISSNISNNDIKCGIKYKINTKCVNCNLDNSADNINKFYV